MKKVYAILTVVLAFFTVNSSFALDYFLKSSGNLSSTGSWGLNSDGTGTTPTNFSGSHTWHVTNRTSIDASTAFNNISIQAAGTMSIHTGVSFTVSGSANISFSCSIDMAPSSTLVIGKSTNFAFRNLDVNSTVIFNSAAYPLQPTSGYTSPAFIQYGNVVINVSNSINGTTSDVNINGILTISASQVFSISTNNLYLYGSTGSIAGTGSLSSTGANIIIFNGSGSDNGTFNFASTGSVVTQFIMFYNTNADRVVLGSDLSVESAGFFGFALGIFDLNGNDLTVDATSDASFPSSVSDGYITGNTNSTMTFEGTFGGGTGFGSLLMDPSNNTLRALILNTSNTLVLGNTLQISDSLSLLAGTLASGGNLTLLSTSSLKARIGRMGSGASITGNINTRTFISGGTTGWMNMGSPGVSGSGVTFAQWDTWATSSGANGIPMTCSGCFYTPMNGTFTSIQSWDISNGTFSNLSASTQMNLGQGYWVYVGDGVSTTNALTVNNAGAYSQTFGSPPSLALSSAGSGTNAGYNLVSNPYASPISWTKLHNLNTGKNINATMHAWAPDAVAYGSYASGAGSGTNGFSDIIPAGQGFYVHVSSGSPNLVFDESVKMTTNTNLLKTSGSNPNEFKLIVSGLYNDKDETMFRFINGASVNFDTDYDGQKLFKTAGYSGWVGPYEKYTSISSRDSKGQYYSVNSLPLLTKDITMPILVRAMYTGTFSISASNVQNLGTCLILYDKLENKYQDLKKGAYTFHISDTTSTPRFELTMCQMESVGPVAGIEETVKDSHIFINQDKQGVYVNTMFTEPTQATISAYNILGQQLVKDVVVFGTENTTRLNISAPGQVAIIRVTTEAETSVKKVILN
jgi:hypothetical protein